MITAQEARNKSLEYGDINETIELLTQLNVINDLINDAVKNGKFEICFILHEKMHEKNVLHLQRLGYVVIDITTRESNPSNDYIIKW